MKTKTSRQSDPDNSSPSDAENTGRNKDDKKSSRSSLNGRVEKRTDPKQSKVSLKKKLNHLLRKRKDGLAESQDPSTSSTESEEQPEDVDDANQSVEEGEDGGALSLADLESDATSPFVTRHAGSTPKLFRVHQDVAIPKSMRKSLGIDGRKSSFSRRSRSLCDVEDKSCPPGGFFSSLTGRGSLAGVTRRPKDLSSSGTSETSSKMFVRDAGSTPRRSRHSLRHSGKENHPEKSSLGASLDLKEKQESQNEVKTDSVKSDEGKPPSRVCQLINENMFCISGISALTINTPPSAYRKMTVGNHFMITRSMKKNKENKPDVDEADIKPQESSLNVAVRKRLSLLDGSVTSSASKQRSEEPAETDFPCEGDSILSRGPSVRFSRRNSLRESQKMNMNLTLTSLHSIMEDEEFRTSKSTRASKRNNTSVASAAPGVFSQFLTPSTKLRKSAKQRNVSSTATCTRHDKKCQGTPEQHPLLQATVKRSKSVTFSNKKEIATAKLSEKRPRSLRLRPASAAKDSARVEMREDAGHTPKPSRKKQEPVDERLI